MVQMKEERLLLQMQIHLRDAIIIIIITLVVYVYT
jgi:hypothetical protein